MSIIQKSLGDVNNDPNLFKSPLITMKVTQKVQTEFFFKHSVYMCACMCKAVAPGFNPLSITFCTFDVTCHGLPVSVLHLQF